ncbi:MAG: DUF4383 domain-containing protein [Pseudonocardia sediminis]
MDSPSRLNALHRISAVVLGVALGVFGVLGFVNRLPLFTTDGAPVLGLNSNGLLSAISLVAGVVLVAAAIRGGRLSSTVCVIGGAAFMLSGVVNVLVLNTGYNLLAFKISNVIFSLLAGLVLLTAGAYGRFTGRLPSQNPYNKERHTDVDAEPGYLPTVYPHPDDAAAARALGEAESAVSRGVATPEQIAGVRAAAENRRHEDRVTSWRTGERRRGAGDQP